MIAYLDPSSIVKLYKDEAASLEVEQLVSATDGIATSRLSYVEVRSAFAFNRWSALERGTPFQSRGLGPGDVETAYGSMVASFERDWNDRQFLRLALDEPALRMAAILCHKYPALRAVDAVHVASAVRLSRASLNALTFSSFDERQLGAAQAEGLNLAH